MRREYRRLGWFIYSGGRLWDNWAYPSEAAARTTAERCKVPAATVREDRRPGITFDDGRQSSQKLLFDRKRRS
jgi:hypothetical protein